MPIPITVIAGLFDIDKAGSAVLFFQIEKICPLSTGNLLTVNFFGRNSSHLHYVLEQESERVERYRVNDTTNFPIYNLTRSGHANGAIDDTSTSLPYSVDDKSG